MLGIRKRQGGILDSVTERDDKNHRINVENRVK